MPSRVAKNPVKVPAGVDVKITDQVILVKGKLGELTKAVRPLVKVILTDGQVHVTAVNESTACDTLSGTMRAIISNMISGVSTGFTKKLVMVGVGYRAKVAGSS